MRLECGSVAPTLLASQDSRYPDFISNISDEPDAAPIALNKLTDITQRHDFRLSCMLLLLCDFEPSRLCCLFDDYFLPDFCRSPRSPPVARRSRPPHFVNVQPYTGPTEESIARSSLQDSHMGLTDIWAGESSVGSFYSSVQLYWNRLRVVERLLCCQRHNFPASSLASHLDA
jgi:hypothetical protein